LEYSVVLTSFGTKPPQPRVRRLVTAAALSLSLAAGAVGISASAAQAASPYEKGPNPTQALLDAPRGPFQVSQVAVTGQSGFGGGQIYYPTDTSKGTYGAVAIVPGFLMPWLSMAWLGPRLASHGFVVIGIETNSGFDDPPSRGKQLLAALDYLVNDQRVSNRIDRSRLAVAGWSMGGGGTLQAALDRPSLKAAIPIAGVHFTIQNFSQVRVPSAFLASENDEIAPPAQWQEPQYQSIPAGTEKIYQEMNDASHFFTVFENNRQTTLMVSWLKRWVDQDTRYTPFICPGPSGADIEEYRSSCPM
jgi:predicted dienelactone hydrolase